MLSEVEVRNIIAKEVEFLESIRDPVARKCTMAFVAGLECVLND